MARRRPRLPARRCPSGKRRFRDHREAVAALAVARSSWSSRRRERRCYECPECRGWHLTSRA